MLVLSSITCPLSRTLLCDTDVEGRARHVEAGQAAEHLNQVTALVIDIDAVLQLLDDLCRLRRYARRRGIRLPIGGGDRERMHDAVGDLLERERALDLGRGEHVENGVAR